MNTKTKIALVAAVIIAAAAIPFALEYQTIGQLRDQLADADTKAKADAREIAKDEAENKRLQGELDDLKGLMAGTGDSGAPAGPNGAPNPANAQSNMAKGLADMMKDPAMHDMIATQVKNQAEKEFADLMKHFNLSPEEKDQFLKLLTDGKMGQVDASMKLMDPSLSPDDRQALAQQIKDSQADSDAQIKTFLNNDADYSTYQLYSKQAPERDAMSTLSTSLASTDEPLTPAQSDAMTDLMYQERTSFQFSDNLSDDAAAADPLQAMQQLTPEIIDSHLQQEQQLQDQIAAKAATVLSPAQLAVFKNNQAQTLQMEKMGLQMAKAMMGPATTGNATAAPAPAP